MPGLVPPAAGTAVNGRSLILRPFSFRHRRHRDSRQKPFPRHKRQQTATDARNLCAKTAYTPWRLTYHFVVGPPSSKASNCYDRIKQPAKTRHRDSGMSSSHNQNRRGFSLMELLAVVTILGIIAAIIVPRVAVSSDTAKAKVAAHHKATINSAVERWYVEKAVWPAADLSDIGADVNYFPSGLPTNPVDNSAYTINATTHHLN
jgi:general secretion pathway protein G